MGSIKLLRILHFPLSITLWGAFASHRYELNWGGEWREEEGSHKGITPPLLPSSLMVMPCVQLLIKMIKISFHNCSGSPWAREAEGGKELFK